MSQANAIFLAAILWKDRHVPDTNQVAPVPGLQAGDKWTRKQATKQCRKYCHRGIDKAHWGLS